jgi:tetratricopeptide (TPR) repeat protein
MTMKRSLIIAAATLTLFGCTAFHRHSGNPYQKRLFIESYLDPANPLDAQIQRTLNDLRANPRSASLHNELGQLLRQKGFPKDAELEFERAVNADRRFYPAWYNLGLLRDARGDYAGARFAFRRAVSYKKGHAAALFQLGLMEEKRQNNDAAIEYYAKAYSINHALLDVRVNPRILDSHLTDLALLRIYPRLHARESGQFEPAPSGYVQQNLQQAPSPPQQQPPPKPPL